MSPDEVKASYRKAFEPFETISIRRYSGSGASRTSADATNCRARVMGYEPHELVGTVLQGDRKIILYADDVSDNGLTLPLTTNDKVVVRGKELAIIRVDDSTRRIGDELIAYELQARG